MLGQGCDTYERLVLPSSFPVGEELFAVEFEALALTRREAEIVRLVTTGASNVAIALSLEISPGTVKKHLDNIYAKLGVSGRGALTALVLDIV
jgi:DNA-binding CsgD family transcriptional regulator